MKYRLRFLLSCLICLSFFILIGLAPVGVIAQDVPETEPRTVRIAVCQTLCIDSDREGNLRRIKYALEAAAAQQAQIACFPETAILGWINPEARKLADPIPGPTTDRLAELAKEHDMMICIGLCEKDGEDLYDAVVLIGAEGKLLAKHRKCNILTELMDPPYARGSADDIAVVDTPLGRIGMLVCADTFKDELVNRIAGQSPDLLLVPYGWAADKSAWPDHGKSLAAWVASTAQRAGCPVVGTDLVGVVSSGPWRGKTYGGQSPVADAGGTILGTLRDRDAEVRMFEIQSQDDAPNASR